MNDVSVAAILSAIRSLLIVAGTTLAAHGYLSATSVDTVVGAIMTILPLLWGMWDKYESEKKTQAREVTAVNAGIVAGVKGVVSAPVVAEAAPSVIRAYAPP